MRVLTTRTAGIVAAGLVVAAALTACGATTTKVKAAATTVPPTTAAATTTTSSTTTEASSTTTSGSSTTGAGGSSTTAGGGSGSGTTVVAPNSDWSSKATDYRGRNGLRVRYSCPAGGTPYSVWGTGYYTDDSSVCTAAVHSGLITLAKGGKVVIQIAPGRSSYTGTTRHGIVTSNWGSWDSSYLFPPQ